MWLKLLFSVFNSTSNVHKQFVIISNENLNVTIRENVTFYFYTNVAPAR